jgi:hypothetical protein
MTLLDQAERRRILEEERRLREKGSTYLSRAQTDLETPGRFGALGKPNVVGVGAPQQWPKMPKDNPWAGPDIIPPEPAFGVPIFAVRERKP